MKEEITQELLKELRELVKKREKLKKRFNVEKELYKIKRGLCVKFGLSFLSNTDLLELIPQRELTQRIRELLITKPSRSASGVNTIAVMTRPHKCPHGKCTYCPGGVERGVPQSYTGEEPASKRARSNAYNPYKQVQQRLRQYYLTGHSPTKIELIIMGGTFTSTPKSYQEWFITKCFQAMNNYPRKKPCKTSLRKEQRRNEVAHHRCVALVVETRPDEINKEVIQDLLRYGVTRVELGVQSLNNEVLRRVKRGHSTIEVKEAMKLLRDSGFKVDAHVMLGLPGTTMEDDVNTIKELFDNPAYRPDGLKIYPTLVIKGTRLYDEWRKGLYTPIGDERVINTLVRVKPLIPYYCRVKRIMRDIPLNLCSAGPTKGNIREIVWKELRRRKQWCDCIRCREAGRARVKRISPRMLKRVYAASGGQEFFLSYEDVKNNVLVSFLRLRIIDDKAFVRELHTYGVSVDPGAQPSSEKEFQHRGYGSKLLRKAEDITRKHGIKELRVLSGVGVRDYYRKRGYRLKNYYMVKKV